MGIETSGLAIPGAPAAAQSAVRSSRSAWRKGTAVDVPSQEIGLVVGEPAQFRFFSSSVRKQETSRGICSRHGTRMSLPETDSLERHASERRLAPDSYVPGALSVEADGVGSIRTLVCGIAEEATLEARIQRA